MGCDIHTLVQVKKDSLWKSVAKNICDDRSYYFFTILCGVRRREKDDTTPQIGNYRGTPEGLEVLPPTCWDDIDAQVMCEGQKHWMGTGIYGWYFLSEMKNFFEENKPFEFSNLENCIAELEKIRIENNVTDDEIRFVFGFDN